MAILKEDLGEKRLKAARAQKLTQSAANARKEKCLKTIEDIKQMKLRANDIYFAGGSLFVVGTTGGCAQNDRVRVDASLKKFDVQGDQIPRCAKQGGASVLVALGVCSQGMAAIRFVEKAAKIDQRVYLEVLKNVYRPDMEMMIGENYTFAQDGAPAHTAKSASQRFEENKVKVGDWRASPPAAQHV